MVAKKRAFDEDAQEPGPGCSAVEFAVYCLIGCLVGVLLWAAATYPGRRMAVEQRCRSVCVPHPFEVTNQGCKCDLMKELR